VNALRFQYPIAVSATLDAKRRLQLPKSLGLSLPLVLVEWSGGHEIGMGLTHADSLPAMQHEGLAITVLRELDSMRPTIPKNVCDRHLLAASTRVWLLTEAHCIAIWAEAGWQANWNAIQLD
jgi:DNA-binding transcriptional regulator/RsmH inhibitor MraZ